MNRRLRRIAYCIILASDLASPIILSNEPKDEHSTKSPKKGQETKPQDLQDSQVPTEELSNIMDVAKKMGIGDIFKKISRYFPITIVIIYPCNEGT